MNAAGQIKRAAVIGATGYTGAELVSLLAHHPGVEIAGCFSASDRGSATMGDLFPQLRSIADEPIRPMDPEQPAAQLAELEPDAVFLATPHEASVSLAPKLLELGAPVFDLSGGFRLAADDYPRWYGFDHAEPELLGSAVYGMPELPGARDRIERAQLVAVPGCYPTAASLALGPVVRAGLADLGRPIVIDATSGVTGAGRSAQVKTLFAEVSLAPYGVLGHRHEPEIRQNVSRADVVFTPHLGSFKRGILATMHVALEEGVSGLDVANALAVACESEAFVRLLPFGSWPSVAAVERTNFVDVQCAVDEDRRHAVVVSAIDNLVKGAAGQALQCMNIRLGLPETLGLLPAGEAGVPA